MSVVGYLNLLHQCSKEINWQSEHEWLILIYKRFIPDGSEDEITDVNSLFAKLEEKSLLGIDRLDILKDLLLGIRKWDLLRMVDEFEVKRKDYKKFLEKISRALDESNQLERLILICKRQNLIAHEREEHIANVNALFTELEEKNNLGIGNLSILRTLANEVGKPDLCRLVDDLEEKGKQEDDAERKRKEWEDYKQRAGEMKLEEKRGLKDRASSDSDVLKERNMATANTKDPFPEREFLPFDRKVRVEEYLQNLLETYSKITPSSDSETCGSTTSEYGFDKGDRLEKFDLVEGFFKDAIENWYIFKEAYEDAYPSEGRVLYAMELEFKTIGITLGTLKEMEKEWMIAEPMLTSSSSAQSVIQQLVMSLQLDQDFFKNPTTMDKRTIRFLARKAKSLKRFDVFEYLNAIVPRGTKGPYLDDKKLIEEIPQSLKRTLTASLKRKYPELWDLMTVLDLRSSDMHYPMRDLADIIARRHGLRTVGDLYDFLCEKGLPFFADIL